jgi:hypothetical protein
MKYLLVFSFLLVSVSSYAIETKADGENVKPPCKYTLNKDRAESLKVVKKQSGDKNNEEVGKVLASPK